MSKITGDIFGKNDPPQEEPEPVSDNVNALHDTQQRALHWQRIVDEFCEFNPYADRVIMGNFAGWIAARGVSVASRAGDAPREQGSTDE